MLAEVALIKLQFVLGHAKKLDQIKKIMGESIVGEISERSLIK